MINLTKGQGINLVKKDGTLKHINVALGWDEVERKKGLLSIFSNDEDIDCDASLACLSKKGKLLGTDYVVYYGHKDMAGVHHSGDDRVGGGNKDNETISITFDKLPNNVERIPIFMNIYDARDRHQNMTSLRNAYIRVYNADTNEELCRYDLDKDLGPVEGFIAGELSKSEDGWNFTAVGESIKNASRISEIINRW